VADVRLAGCRSTPLLGYLKGLGVLRAVSRQADPQARARWRHSTFELRSELHRDDLVAFFLHRYAPPPVVSPWNGGSGFFPKDKQGQDAFAVLEASDDARVQPLVRAIRSARELLTEMGLTQKPEPRVEKPELLRQLRGRLDDDAVAWLDTAIALTGGEPSPAPLLGSGGNEGRLEFGVNFAVAAVQALGLVHGKVVAPARRQELLDVSLHGGAGRLERLSVGHLDRDLAPGGLERGDFDALASPWDVLLGLEGAQVLAAGVARRHGVGRDAIVAPFTARATPTAFASASGEDTRGEMWLPLWPSWWLLRELEAVTREARAQVGSRRAVTGLDFARAAGELGVARGITAFERFVLAKRAGRDHAAVPAGQVGVTDRPAVRALRDLDPWLQRLRRPREPLPASALAAIGRLERAIFALAARGRPSEAQAVLEAMGVVEATLARSGQRAEEAEQHPPDNVAAGPLLQAADDGSAELVVAAALGSLRDRRRVREGGSAVNARPTTVALRDMLLGTGFDDRGRRSYAHGRLVAPARARALERLAALHAQRALEAERSDRRLVFELGRPCPLRLAGALAGEQLDTERVLRLAAGLALLDHGRDRLQLGGWSRADAFPPEPALEILALAVHGLGPAGPPALAGRPAADEVPVSAADDSRADSGARFLGRPSWITQLRAGAVKPVLREALLRLHAVEAEPIVTADDVLAGAPSGPGLAAALLLRPSFRDLRRAAGTFTCLGDQAKDSHALDPDPIPLSTQGAPT